MLDIRQVINKLVDIAYTSTLLYWFQNNLVMIVGPVGSGKVGGKQVIEEFLFI